MSSDATARVRRFLDARDGYFPIDVLAVVTRTGDRLLASDLRTLLDELARVEALADEWDHDITELRDSARRHGDMVADWHADARQQHLRQLRAALDAKAPGHRPIADDGVTYCGWATDHGVIDGCGEVWPCSTVRGEETADEPGGGAPMSGRPATGAIVPERQRCICNDDLCLDHCRACNFSSRDLEEPCIADPDWTPDDDDLARREARVFPPDGHEFDDELRRSCGCKGRGGCNCGAPDERCATCSGRGVWMDEPCRDCTRPVEEPASFRQATDGAHTRVIPPGQRPGFDFRGRPLPPGKDQSA